MYSSGIKFNLISYLFETHAELTHHIIYLANDLQEGVQCAKSGRFASVHCGLPDDIDKPSGVCQLPHLIRIYTGAGIRSVTLMDRPISEMTRIVVNRLREAGLHVSIVGVDSVERAKKWIEVGADVFNTDKLTPGDLQ